MSKLHELALACNNGVCNLSGIIRSLGKAIAEVPPGKCHESLDLKIIIGQLSFLLGESCGPSQEAVEEFNRPA